MSGIGACLLGLGLMLLAACNDMVQSRRRIPRRSDPRQSRATRWNFRAHR